MTPTILAIDQGTASTRAMLFDTDGEIVAMAQRPLRQIFPASGQVEHDPEEIWQATVAVVNEVASGRSEIAAIGITNQRETTVLWERATGRPVNNAIVWQDRRTADLCRAIIDAGHEPLIQAKTGLIVDPYFSASKIRWLLDNLAGHRQRAEAGEICFGTIDSYLIWKLSSSREHLTDATNASRTMLFDIHTGRWDDDLLAIWDIPPAILPDVRDSSGDFGAINCPEIDLALPINGVAGDQHAAMVGQAAFEPGMVKSTYGTGNFLLLNTGSQPLPSTNRLLTTLAYQLDGQPAYALEGSSYAAGSTIQWLRDGLGLLENAAESGRLAAEAGDTGDVYLVPAFTGLGAPYWDADARGAIFGLTRDTSRAQIVRAALESVAFQTRDLLEAMHADGAGTISELRVDGGMVTNDWLCQRLSDLIGIPVHRPQTIETTALGAAYLAGLGAGVYSGLAEVSSRWHEDQVFEPAMGQDERDERFSGWRAAVGRVLTEPSRDMPGA